MILRSRIYTGWVSHRRLKPKIHDLKYRVFWLLLDLDEIDSLDDRCWLFSRNHFNALSLFDEDYGDGGEGGLKAQVLAHLHDGGIETDGVSVALLTMPRIFGYAFNPLSLYFVSDAQGETTAILYEVSNTFGERHSYLMPVEASVGGVVEQACPKDFYVSPFMDMDLDYRFRVRVPGAQVGVQITASDREGPMLLAALHGKAEIVSDRALLRVLFSYPLLTLKVIAAIHWHALKLFLKGIRLRSRPAPPDRSVSFPQSR